MYLDELKHCFRCIEHRRLPLIDGAQGQDALAIAYAAQTSLKQTIGAEMSGHEQ